MKEIKETILRICDEALEGRITLDEFYDRWPCGTDSQSEFRTVFLDLEDGITHSPGKFFSKGVDMPEWERSGAFWKIKEHSLKLKQDLEAQDQQ